MQGVQKPYVKVEITNNLSRASNEKNYRRDLTIGELKCKLELITGCDWNRVRLELFDCEGVRVMALDDDSRMLGAYPVEDGMRIHCTDDSKSFGEYDLPGAEEDEIVDCGFELTEEEYDRRPNTFRAWLRANKLGRFREPDLEEERRVREAREAVVAAEAAAAAKMQTGDRCEVDLHEKELFLPSHRDVRGFGAARGTVMFVGGVGTLDGHWVGVRLDEPFGVTDGAAEGRRFFQCDPKYGVFAKPAAVRVGDFPELGIEDLDEI